MEWDDEELDTQIFDKDEPIEVVDAKAADDLFFEDDDRTVANEPPPDILEQARQPGAAGAAVKATPAPLPAPRGVPAPAPAPAARASAPAPKSTLVGMPAPNLPAPVRNPPPPAGPGPSASQGPPQGLAGLRRSGLNMPAPVLPPPTAPPQPVFSFDAQKPAATGPFTAAPPARGGRAGRTFLLLVVVAAAVAGGYWYQNTSKPGRLQLVTVPGDATVLVDNTKVGDHSPVALDKPPGNYTLSVTKDGYVRNDQNIEIRAGQPLALSVTLEPSPDTGFELSSDPPGGLVWLDGSAMSGPNGQARTDFRALRIPPGHHVLEIKGENRFRPWKEDIEVEPGSIRKIHATLVPSGDGGGHGSARAEKAETKPPETKPAETKPAEAKAETKTEPAATVAEAPATSPARGGRKKKAREVAASDEPKETAKAAEAAGGSDCTITIGSRPWAEVWIDGKNTNKHTPFADYKIACGKHKIVFKRPDLNIDQTETISVSPGEKFKQSYSLLNDSE